MKMTKQQFLNALNDATNNVKKLSLRVDQLNAVDIIDVEDSANDSDIHIAIDALENAVEDLAISDLLGLEVKR